MTIKIGDKVIVRPGFGTEPPVRVRVSDLDTKNGQKLIVYLDDDGHERWAYINQIVRVK